MNRMDALAKIRDRKPEGCDTTVWHTLLNHLGTNVRVRLHYGDKQTGRDWLEEFDVTGQVNITSGEKPGLLLVHNERSMGGNSILTDCIVKIRAASGGRVLWQHPNYHYGLVSLEAIDETAHGKRYRARINVNGQYHAQFESSDKALRWLKKMGLELHTLESLIA